MTEEKDFPSKDPSRRSSAWASGRRYEFLSLALENLEVGRQNQHDSQFSPDAKLVEFYEGIALSLQEPVAFPASYADIKRHFQEAAKLLTESEQTKDYSQKLVGLEALCNLATVQQREALGAWQFEEAIRLDDPAFELLKSAAYKYRKVLSDGESILPSDKLRIQLTARLGLLVCVYSSWRSGRSSDPDRTVNSVGQEALDLCKELQKQVNALQETVFASNRSKPEWNDSWANSIVLRQIKVALLSIRKGTGHLLSPSDNESE